MKNLSIFILLIITLFMSSCEGDDPTPENPEELITTLLIQVVPHGGGTAQTFQFFDFDGDGGSDPIIIGGTLDTNTEYHATLMVQNGTVDPVEDLNAEILAEDEDHQFFFSFKGVDVTQTYDDMDSDGNPLGIVNTWMTGDAGIGTLTVTLRHHLNKSANGVPTGDISNAGGDTDIEVTYPVFIQ